MMLYLTHKIKIPHLGIQPTVYGSKTRVSIKAVLAVNFTSYNNLYSIYSDYFNR